MVKERNYPKTINISKESYYIYQELKPKRMTADDFLNRLIDHSLHCANFNRDFLYKKNETRKGLLKRIKGNS